MSVRVTTGSEQTRTSGVERPTSHNDLDVAIAMLSHGLKLSFYAYDRLKERRIHKEQELGRAAGNP